MECFSSIGRPRLHHKAWPNLSIALCRFRLSGYRLPPGRKFGTIEYASRALHCHELQKQHYRFQNASDFYSLLLLG